MLATVEKLDPATGVWTRKTDLPQAAYPYPYPYPYPSPSPSP